MFFTDIITKCLTRANFSFTPHTVNNKQKYIVFEHMNIDNKHSKKQSLVNKVKLIENDFQTH